MTTGEFRIEPDIHEDLAVWWFRTPDDESPEPLLWRSAIAVGLPGPERRAAEALWDLIASAVGDHS